MSGVKSEQAGERLGKEASYLAPFLNGFTDELTKIANLSGTSGSPTTLSEVKSTIPKNTLKTSGTYSKVHSDMSESPVANHQPVLGPPPVRG